MNTIEAYVEFNRRLSRDFVPSCADDLIGDARDTALMLEKAVRLAKANGNSPRTCLHD